MRNGTQLRRRAGGAETALPDDSPLSVSPDTLPLLDSAFHGRPGEIMTDAEPSSRDVLRAALDEGARACLCGKGRCLHPFHTNSSPRSRC